MKTLDNSRQRIGELLINEECVVEIEAGIANLKNSGSLSGRNASVNIEKELKERKDQLTKFEATSTKRRSKLEKSDRGIL